MIEEPLQPENSNLYTSKAVSIATFIGGPLAAGYLIRENYNTLNNPVKGNRALIFGIISTIILFTGLFLIPDNIIDSVPNQILPIIYTLIVYFLAEKEFGSIIKENEEKGFGFLSNWRAAGIGAISLIVISIALFTVIYLESPDAGPYQNEMELFTQNEDASLKFYDKLNAQENNIVLMTELNTISIPKTKKNIRLLKDLDDVPEFNERKSLLLEYSELRLKAFEIFKLAIIENTNKYDGDLSVIHDKIDTVLAKLNES